MNHEDRIKELEELCKDRNFQITRLQVEKEQAEAELSNKSHTATRLHTRAEQAEAREKVLREALEKAKYEVDRIYENIHDGNTFKAENSASILYDEIEQALNNTKE